MLRKSSETVMRAINTHIGDLLAQRGFGGTENTPRQRRRAMMEECVCSLRERGGEESRRRDPLHRSYTLSSSWSVGKGIRRVALPPLPSTMF